MVVSGVDKPMSNLPWVEKYRPQKLNDLVSHDEIVSTISRFVDEDRLPHLLFYGPPGTGKTSIILAVAKQLYTKQQFTSMVLELNASDDRGIEVVRQTILNFASTRTIFNKGYKLVILDEADAMTNDAQNALRRIIEKFTDNVRFCIICNYLYKIIPALQSRCTRFRFGPLAQKQILPRLQSICEAEHIELSGDGRKALMNLAAGDMRQVLNILQSCAMAFRSESSDAVMVVDQERIHRCVGQPTAAEVSDALRWLLNDPVRIAFKNIADLQKDKGLSLIDLIAALHPLVHRIEMADEFKKKLVIGMAGIEESLLMSAAPSSEPIQLAALVAVFYNTRLDLKNSASL